MLYFGEGSGMENTLHLYSIRGVLFIHFFPFCNSFFVFYRQMPLKQNKERV